MKPEYSIANHHCGSHHQYSLYSLPCKLLDMKFQFAKNITHTAFDLVESMLDIVCPQPKNAPTGSCATPQPCWMPKSLGEYCSKIDKEGKAKLTFIVTNDDYKELTYDFSDRSTTLTNLTFTPASLTLKPKQRAEVVVEFTLPALLPEDKKDFDLLIWIDSCRNYYLRWHPKDQCLLPKEIRVCLDDVPNYELHWYDHFYALKPCMG